MGKGDLISDCDNKSQIRYKRKFLVRNALFTYKIFFLLLRNRFALPVQKALIINIYFGLKKKVYAMNKRFSSWNLWWDLFVTKYLLNKQVYIAKTRLKIRIQS